MVTFGERIKELREINNISLQELAEALKSTKSTLSRYENNIMQPRATFVQKMAEYFGVTTDYMLGKTHKPHLVLKDNLPFELENIGIKYLIVAKELQDMKIDINEIEKIIKIYKEVNKLS